MSATGVPQGPSFVVQYISSQAAVAFSDPTKYPDWAHIIGAGSTVLTNEDGTSVTITTDATEPQALIPGPFKAFTSTTATRVRMGNGDPPAMVSLGTNAPMTLVTPAATATFTGTANNIYEYDTTGGAITANIPSAASAGAGARIGFVNVSTSTNAVTIAPASGNVNGATTNATLLAASRAKTTLQSDGTAWFSIA